MHLKANTSVPDGFVRTDLGVLPESWPVLRLAECLRSSPSYGINAPAVPFDDALNTYIRITDITDDGKYNPDPPVSVIVKDPSKYALRPGDLVVARTGASVGKSYLYNPGDGDLVYAGFLIRLQPEPTVLDPGFFSYFLQSKPYWDWISTVSTRSGQPGVNGLQLSGMPVPAPSPKEQRAIAETLRNLDALLASLDALIEKKRAIKKGTMQQLLTGRTRLPGFGEGWEEKRFDEIASINPESLGTETDPSFTFPYISIEDVEKGQLRGWSQEEFRSAPSRARRVIRAGDVMMSTVRPGLLGHFHYDGTPPNAVCSTGFAVLRCHSSVAEPGYVYSQLFTKGLGDQVDALLAGSNYPAINRTEVAALRIPCPPAEEQQAIANVLWDMDAELRALNSRREKTDAIKKGMMQQLLTGRVRLVKGEQEATA